LNATAINETVTRFLELRMSIDGNGVSPEEAKRINSALQTAFPGTKVEVVSKDASSLCTDACNIGLAVANQLCDDLGGGLPTAICKIAAGEAHRQCLNACD